MDFSRTALTGKAGQFLKNRQWAPARQLADRILDLEEEPFARWVKWVTAIAQGDEEDADLQIKKAKDKRPDARLFSMKAHGWFCIGDITQTMKFMRQAENAGAKLEHVSSQLAVLAKSSEYHNSKEENSK